ncbi:O-unit flippase [Lysobacter helvus]|uniref:O-unit flippase n=2 Tax=Lysobacteraceae TaxID=32033 RepID=A0ABM7Q393_9GAMM|nr:MULTISPECIES: oligosaccharide flippase family protein [Lysobacter]BCT91746.1 O-unit flippase [Lysobacter caseinilyticus]BCT94899.1 O-unit flippase [Lysobacter helvus]
MNTPQAGALGRTLRWLRDSQVARQFGWLAMAKIVQGVASLAAALAVARALGPVEFGALSLAIAIASFVAMIAALGLEQIATRELVAADSGARTLALLRRLRWSGALLGAAALLAVSVLPQVHALGASHLVLILALLPLAQVGDLAEWRLIASGHGRRVAMAVVAVSPLAALVRVVLAFGGFGVVAFAWVLVAEWALRSLLLSLLARGLGTQSGEGVATVALRDALELLRESTPLLLAGIAVFAYMRIDQFMIAAMLGQQQVGLYSAVVTLAELPLVVPTLLLRAALPTLTRQSMDNPLTRDRTLVRLMGVSVYLHLAMSVVLALLAEPLVVLAYGEAYRGAAEAFRLQVLAAPLVALGVLSSGWLVLERRTGHALRRTVLGAVANIGLNFWLIPAYGIAGAAMATLAAQALATWLADAAYRDTRGLFMMKTRALWPGNWGRT